MLQSSILSNYSVYSKVFQDENSRLGKKNRREDRLIIEKGELIGQKWIEAMMLEYVFLEKDYHQQHYETALEEVFPLINRELNIDKAYVRRTIAKLFVQKEHEKLDNIFQEMKGFIEKVLSIPVLQKTILESTIAIKQEDDTRTDRLSNNSSTSHTKQILNTFNNEGEESFRIFLDQSQSSFSDNNQVQRYLDKEVMHMKTELTEFCHQLRIPEPRYQRLALMGMDKHQFNIKCVIMIPEDERNSFNKVEYVEVGAGLNTKSASNEAAKKMLVTIYSNNLAIWNRYKAIKQKKGITT